MFSIMKHSWDCCMHHCVFFSDPLDWALLSRRQIMLLFFQPDMQSCRQHGSSHRNSYPGTRKTGMVLLTTATPLHTTATHKNAMGQLYPKLLCKSSCRITRGDNSCFSLLLAPCTAPQAASLGHCSLAFPTVQMFVCFLSIKLINGT